MSRRRKLMMLFFSLSQEILDFITRVEADGGTVESPECLTGKIDGDFCMIPAGYKPTKVYSQKGITGVDDFTMERNCTKYRTNKLGLLEEMGFNVLAPDYADGECGVNLHEGESTNLYLNSELNNVENQTVTATPYTAFLYGTGTITFSGAFIGTLIGTGVNDKVEITFTPSAGTLTSADSGGVDKKQLENLSYSTSYIKTQGASVTRFKDIVKDAGDVNSFNSEEGVLYAECARDSNDGANGGFLINDGTNDNAIRLFFNQVDTVSVITAITGVNEVVKTAIPITSSTVMNKFAVMWKLNDYQIWYNGVKIAFDTSAQVYPLGTLNNINMDNNGTPFNGKVKALKVFKTALTSQQLLELTTDGFVTTP